MHRLLERLAILGVAVVLAAGTTLAVILLPPQRGDWQSLFQGGQPTVFQQLRVLPRGDRLGYLAFHLRHRGGQEPVCEPAGDSLQGTPYAGWSVCG